jgi:DNA gyrase inhibitor GyrI
MPKNMAATSVPMPNDGALRRREIPAGRFAVYRFRGGRSLEREVAVLGELQSWLKGREISLADAMPVYGYFDPPWTPSMFRRNEVMLRIQDPAVR